MNTTTEIIAKEGWKPIFISLLGLWIMWLLDWTTLSVLFLLLVVCLVYFYRNPERIPEDIADDCVLAPLDGIIENIENKEDGIHLLIKKPICFCGLLRMPFAKSGKSAEAMELEHRFGLKNGDSITGEYVKIAFRYDENDNKEQIFLTLYPKNFTQIALYLWDSSFKLGERLGFFLSGNAMLVMPLESELRVSIGDKIYAGQTLLGKINSTQSKINLKELLQDASAKEKQE